MVSFDLHQLTEEEELDLAFFVDTETGVWRLGTERQTLVSGNLAKDPPSRFSCQVDQYRLGLATGVLRLPSRRLAECGGFSGILGGEPVPELDDLIMPGFEFPVAHVFLEVPGCAPCGILRVLYTGSSDVPFSLVTNRDAPERGGEIDPAMDLSYFFAWCEEKFGLLPPG